MQALQRESLRNTVRGTGTAPAIHRVKPPVTLTRSPSGPGEVLEGHLDPEGLRSRVPGTEGWDRNRPDVTPVVGFKGLVGFESTRGGFGTH